MLGRPCARFVLFAALLLVFGASFGATVANAVPGDFLVWGQGTTSSSSIYQPGVIVGVGSTLYGDVGSRGDVYCNGGVTLNGDVETASQFGRGNGVTVNGAIVQNSAGVQQPLPAPAVISPGTVVVPTLPSSGSFAFVPGLTYKAVSGGAGCSLYFTSGTYSFDSLKFANGTTLYMNLSGGPIRILVRGQAFFGADLDTAITSVVGDANDISLESQWMGTAGSPYAFTAGGGSDWLGNVYCPFGGIHFGSGSGPTSFQGYFWSGWPGIAGTSRQQSVYIEHGVVGIEPPAQDPAADLPVVVSKTVHPSVVRRWNWTIAKSVAPATWNLFAGDTGESRYTVSVDKTDPVQSYVVTGTITVRNDSDQEVTIVSVSDVITVDLDATITSGPSLPHMLPSGDTTTFEYAALLPDGTDRMNRATAVISAADDSWSAECNEPVSFAGAPVTETNGTVHVTDTNGESWQFSDDASVTYDRTFACSDAGVKNNTAKIVETGQSDSAAVTVRCFSLRVTETASTHLTRTYGWTIDKSADHSALTLTTGQQVPVNYSVRVSVASVTDSGWKATGAITIQNPAPVAATINSLSDVVSPAIAATITDPPTFPYTLAAGGTLVVHYAVDLPNATIRANTATALLQNRDYLLSGTTLSGTTGFTGQASVNFSGAALSKVDECVDVTDTYTGPLGTVCYGVGTLPRVFTYSRLIGPFATSGSWRVDNTASFETNDTGTTGSDDWSVDVHIPSGGATLTPGYWKTHSKYGPARYDDVWACIQPAAEDSPFYASGKTWYQTLWTNPRGNPYFILSYQYIAARLNVCNAASYPEEVGAAMTWADTFFSAYSPTATFNKALKAQIIQNASMLSDYNAGVIGPGHADE